MAVTSLIGLDIGSTSIRAVEAGLGREGPAVTNYAEVLLPPGAVQSGVVQDPKAVTLAVRQLRTAAPFKSKQTVLGVTNMQAVVREMAVANLPPKDLRASLPFQVRDLLPLPVERSVLDFLPLEDPGHAETVRGLLVAAPKEPILAAVDAVERAGLTVLRVDLSSLALLRAAARLDDQVEAIVDVGTQMTTVVVHADGVPLIVRTIPRGGAEITAALATRLGVPLPEAEALKCRIGLWAENGPEVADTVREAIRPLFNEIRGSFAYLSTSGRHSQVARLILAGGGGQLPGLPDTLAGQLDLQVEHADPMSRLRRTRRARHDGMEALPLAATVSLGLTLGAA
ncbi:type IV pilus assembly protein PilM [Cryptosporangium aurantiacum]|uniref:Type IV pilus assembly protein PilM n=1 Tax=Cryptosporangium aurantiacum TaxID=134849 RepID=A0A1M7PTR9_9ACTN|nr:type IV pilus assembly protein PilM [Cryptosporangium aurantiacum]SHN20917.1 type IV pilus assembly protein PilM [Cryptosporangium aurantiacum]